MTDGIRKATIRTGKYKGQQGEIVGEADGQYRVAINGHVFTYAPHSVQLQAEWVAKVQWPPCLNAEKCREKLKGQCHFMVIGPPWHCTQYAPDGEYRPEVDGLRCPGCGCQDKALLRLVPTGWRWVSCPCGYTAALMRFQTKKARTPLREVKT